MLSDFTCICPYMKLSMWHFEKVQFTSTCLTKHRSATTPTTIKLMFIGLCSLVVITYETQSKGGTAVKSRCLKMLSVTVTLKRHWDNEKCRKGTFLPHKTWMGGCKNDGENKNESRQRMTPMHQRNKERKSSGWGNAVKEKSHQQLQRKRDRCGMLVARKA